MNSHHRGSNYIAFDNEKATSRFATETKSAESLESKEGCERYPLLWVHILLYDVMR